MTPSSPHRFLKPPDDGSRAIYLAGWCSAASALRPATPTRLGPQFRTPREDTIGIYQISSKFLMRMNEKPSRWG